MSAAYIYRAALYCEGCAEKLKREIYIKPFGEIPCDSDQYPQGPYSNGGGEADTPQHCDACHAFLENALTGDGVAYVRDSLAPYIAPDDGDSPDWSVVADRAEEDGRPVVATWARYYSPYLT